MEQQRQPTVSHSPSTPSPLSSAPSSSPPSAAATRLQPSPLLHSLPAAAADRVRGFLGFTVLMDLRCLSRSAARRLEDAALQWMNHHLLRPELRLTSSSSPSSPSTPEVAARPSPPFCFDHADAVWFRQQLSRWRFNRLRVDADSCLLSPVEAWRAYGVQWREHLQRPWPTPRTPPLTASYLVRDVARHLFRGYFRLHSGQQPRHAAAFARQLEDGRAQRTSGLNRTAYRALVAREKDSAQRWRACRPVSMLVLPAAVVYHSVLACLGFEELMELRSVSRALQPLMETAAVLRLNQQFPSGLNTIAERQEEARQLAEEARLKAEMKRQKAEEKRQKGRKRKRADASPTSSDASAVMDSASVASSSSSSLSASTFSPSPTPSYTVAHAVWVMQLLQWSRRLWYTARRELGEPPNSVLPTLCQTQFLSRFPLRAEWTQRFGRPSPTTRSRYSGRWGKGADRYSVHAVLDLLLDLYGGDVGQSGKKRRKRTGSGQRREAWWGSSARQAAGCPALLSTNGATRCPRCAQIGQAKQSGMAVEQPLHAVQAPLAPRPSTLPNCGSPPLGFLLQ